MKNFIFFLMLVIFLKNNYTNYYKDLKKRIEIEENFFKNVILKNNDNIIEREVSKEKIDNLKKELEKYLNLKKSLKIGIFGLSMYPICKIIELIFLYKNYKLKKENKLNFFEWIKHEY